MRLGSLVRILTIVAFVALAGGGAQATGSGARPSAASFPFQLRHWWPADGDAIDVVGNDDGTLRGATFAPGVHGDDQAFSFDGSGQEVRFDDRGGNFGRQDFTLAYFVQTTTGQAQSLWEKRLVCNANSFWGFRMTGTVGAELMSDQLAQEYTQGFVSTTDISDGLWHHVALVRGGRTASLYIDGQLEATTTSTRGIDLWNDAPLRAGMSVCVGIDGTAPFTGALDELMIFDQALSQDEVQAVIDHLTGDGRPAR